MVDGKPDYDRMQYNVEEMLRLPKTEWAHAEALLLQRFGLTGWVQSYYAEYARPDKATAQSYESLTLEKHASSYAEGKCHGCYEVKMMITHRDLCRECANKHAEETTRDSFKNLPKNGSFILAFGGMDDPKMAVVVDGDVVAGYYMSSRGGMWQAGAFVWNEEAQSGQWLAASNFRAEEPCGDWYPGKSTCADVGYDTWTEMCHAAYGHLLDLEPNQFWEGAPSKEEYLAEKQAMMKRAVKGYDEGAARVERRKKNQS